MSNMFDKDDFSIGYDWRFEDIGRVMVINHFKLEREHRGHGRASAILETLVRVAYYEDGDAVRISMGGGDEAKAFLERNGFTIERERPYEQAVKQIEDRGIEGDYGVDAVRRLDESRRLDSTA